MQNDEILKLAVEFNSKVEENELTSEKQTDLNQALDQFVSESEKTYKLKPHQLKFYFNRL